MMDYQEAIEVLQDKNTCIGTTNCDDNAWKLLNPAINTAISAMQELQMYKYGKLCLIPESVYSKQCTELDAYKQLGTLEEVREALEKAEKYHWHDLRKNPEDLPENLSGIYLFENKWGQVFKGTFRAVGDIKLFETHIYSKEHGGDIWIQYKTCNVIRWKEIEPFEED